MPISSSKASISSHSSSASLVGVVLRRGIGDRADTLGLAEASFGREMFGDAGRDWVLFFNCLAAFDPVT